MTNLIIIKNKKRS